jgi:hypothetical protein
MLAAPSRKVVLAAAFAILAIVFASVAYAAYRHSTPAGPDTFQANTNGTVTDLTTGLQWTANAAPATSTSYTESEASAYCVNLTLAGYHWRLPSMYELQRLIIYSPSNPPNFDDNMDPPPQITVTNTTGGGYTPVWSSTVYSNAASGNIGYWVAEFGDNSTNAVRGTTSPDWDAAVLCVRAR